MRQRSVERPFNTMNITTHIPALHPTEHFLPVGDRSNWALDPAIAFLNHGAFGACPIPVLEAQTQWRARLERQPLQFLARELEPALDVARAGLARFVGADPDDLVFVPNSTAGVNTVLRSLVFQPGDELLTTDHAYNACRNALDFVAERSGATVVVAKLPFPFNAEDDLVAPILGSVTAKTRLVLLDHITSATGFVLPLERIIRELHGRDVEVLVDGAHAPGMIPLNLKQLGATYYTGNCHKWLCAPKGAAFLHVQRTRQPMIRPLVISHGANSKRTDRSRFLREFAWPGTWDPSACLCVPEALRFLEAQLPGGWPAVMARNHALAIAARRILSDALQVFPPCPPEFLGSLATLSLPDAPPGKQPQPPVFEYPLQDRLRIQHGIEVPIMPWPNPPHRLIRIAPHLYNSLGQYKQLAKVLAEELNRGE
jgi:isopenicillin-N epimerase